ncbi:MAG: single-stranded-DNA-specific exonuclease RecJ [Candidatus Abawacabacteria bacterium]|nr:single-stranded-DNA-specific exonuclease RecJ [Candidatus Abawacabacteria bacterium]
MNTPALFQHWEIRQKRTPYQALDQVLLSSRNIQDSSFFSLNYSQGIYDPFLFRHMGKAVDRIVQAIKGNEGVLIAGDYDLDGISGTSLLLDFFRYIRFPAQFKLPHRVEDGYGLHTKTIIEAHKAHIKVIITVDNGISCQQEVALAQSLGIDVIITDHHTIPEKIPPAYAILHPKIAEETYPDKELTGSGVAYKLTCALAKKLLPEAEAENYCKWSLDLATLGTIADMGLLVGENRHIVHFGLQVLSKQRRPGIKKLLVFAGHQDANCNADVVGFKLGPRLNAAGRMERADLSVQLLMSSNEQEAEQLAAHLEKLNNERKNEAEKAFLLADQSIADKSKSVLIAQSNLFHPGVIGLAASKLVERYQRPVLILELREDVAIGSMRSIPGIDLMPILYELKPFFIKFGGHAQAAGFSVTKEQLAGFIVAMETLFDRHLPLPPPTLMLDTELYASDITLEACNQLEKFEPFGIGNTKPLFFMESAILKNVMPLGSSGKHWKLQLMDQRVQQGFQAVIFNTMEAQFKPEMNLAVRLNMNIWNNQKSPQIIIEHIQ